MNYKLKRSFYNLSPAVAFSEAYRLANANGAMNWSVLREVMARYEQVRQRRLKRQDSALANVAR